MFIKILHIIDWGGRRPSLFLKNMKNIKKLLNSDYKRERKAFFEALSEIPEIREWLKETGKNKIPLSWVEEVIVIRLIVCESYVKIDLLTIKGERPVYRVTVFSKSDLRPVIKIYGTSCYEWASKLALFLCEEEING